jgi:hypothetical protein
MKIYLAELELFHAYRQTGRQKDGKNDFNTLSEGF